MIFLILFEAVALQKLKVFITGKTSTKQREKCPYTQFIKKKIEIKKISKIYIISKGKCILFEIYYFKK